jgi:hypothetical protein
VRVAPTHAAAATGRARWLGWTLPVHRYALAVPHDDRRVLGAAWLALATAALIASGLFAVLLVLARTPGINAHLPGVDFFHVALVVHVDLSVLVWFFAMAGALWTLGGAPRGMAFGWFGWALAAIGAALMAIVPPPARTGSCARWRCPAASASNCPAPACCASASTPPR